MCNSCRVEVADSATCGTRVHHRPRAGIKQPSMSSVRVRAKRAAQQNGSKLPSVLLLRRPPSVRMTSAYTPRREFHELAVAEESSTCTAKGLFHGIQVVVPDMTCGGPKAPFTKLGWLRQTRAEQYFGHTLGKLRWLVWTRLKHSTGMANEQSAPTRGYWDANEIGA